MNIQQEVIYLWHSPTGKLKLQGLHNNLVQIHGESLYMALYQYHFWNKNRKIKINQLRRRKKLIHKENNIIITNKSLEIE